MLSVSYAETKRREEELAAKADFYHELANDLLTPLTRVSTSIQVADMMPDEAAEILKGSQEDIMTMADMINKALEEARNAGGDGK
jgi:signal transduction histidine kinase